MIRQKRRKVASVLVIALICTNLNTSSIVYGEKKESIELNEQYCEDKILEIDDNYSSDNVDIPDSSDINNESDIKSQSLIVVTDNGINNSYDAEYVIELGDYTYLCMYDTLDKAELAYKAFKSRLDVISVEQDVYVDTEENKDSTYSITEDTEEIDTEKTNDKESIDENTEKDTEQHTEPTEEKKVENDDIKIAVVDTGLNSSVLDDQFKSFIVGEDTTDENGHGTEVVELMINTLIDNGFNMIKIEPIKVANEYGKCSLSQLYLGIEKAISDNADIINVSMGAKCVNGSSLIDKAIEDAYNANKVVVTSAGNNGEDVKNYVPANNNKAVVVGSIGVDKQILDTSNYGETVDCVHFGENIKLKDGLTDEDTTVSGTSYSCAIVSALLAVKIQYSDRINIQEIVDQSIINDSTDLGDAGFDTKYGWGIYQTYIPPMEDKSDTSEKDDNNSSSDSQADNSNIEKEEAWEDDYASYYVDSNGDIRESGSGKLYISNKFIHNIVTDEKNKTLKVYIGNKSDEDFINMEKETNFEKIYKSMFINSEDNKKEYKEYNEEESNKTKNTCYLSNAKSVLDDDSEIIHDKNKQESNKIKMLNDFEKEGKSHNDWIEYLYGLNKAVIEVLNTDNNIVHTEKTGYYYCIGCKTCQTGRYVLVQTDYHHNNTCGTCARAGVISYGWTTVYAAVWSCTIHGWVLTLNDQVEHFKCDRNGGEITAGNPPETQTHTYCDGHPNTYTIKYNGNGATSGSTADQSATYDKYLNLRNNGFKKEYTVKFDSKGGNSIADKKVSAKTNGAWKTVSKTYNQGAKVRNLTSVNGGVVTMKIQWAAIKYKLPSCTKPGYTFDGWSKTNGGDADYDAGDTITVTANVKLYAVWSPNESYISYNANGGTMTTSPKEHDGKWYKIGSKGNIYRSDTQNGTYTLYKRTFRKTSAAFNLINIGSFGFKRTGYHYDDGQEYLLKRENGQVVKVDQDTNYGPTFWSPNINTKDEKATVIVNWKKNNYYVVYTAPDAKSGSMDKSKHKYDFDSEEVDIDGNLDSTDGSKATLSKNKFKQYIELRIHKNSGDIIKTNLNVEFADWIWNGDTYSDEEEIENLTSVRNKELTFKAEWEDWSDDYTLPVSDTKTGYKFLGWSTSSNGSVEYTGGEVYSAETNANNIKNGVDLYPIFEALSYKVKYKGNGATSGEVAEQNPRIDETFNLRNNGFTKYNSITFIGTKYGKEYTLASNNENSKYLNWVNESNSLLEYSAGQSVKNLSTVGNETINLLAKWENPKAVVPRVVTYYTNVKYYDGGYYNTNKVTEKSLSHKPLSYRTDGVFKSDNGTLDGSRTYTYNGNETLKMTYTHDGVDLTYNPSVTYKVTYDYLDGTTKDSEHQVNIDKWYTDSNFKNEAASDMNTDVEEIALYGKYKKYTETLITPVKDGWEFKGWYSSKTNQNDSNFVGLGGKTITFDGNVKLYARWSKPVKLTIKTQGGLYNGSSNDIVITGTLYNLENEFKFNINGSKTGSTENSSEQNGTIDKGTYTGDKKINSKWTKNLSVNGHTIQMRYIGLTTSNYSYSINNSSVDKDYWYNEEKREPDIDANIQGKVYNLATFKCNNVDSANEISLSDNLTLYAVWEPIVNAEASINRVIDNTNNNCIAEIGDSGNMTVDSVETSEQFKINISIYGKYSYIKNNIGMNILSFYEDTKDGKQYTKYNDGLNGNYGDKLAYSENTAENNNLYNTEKYSLYVPTYYSEWMYNKFGNTAPYIYGELKIENSSFYFKNVVGRNEEVLVTYRLNLKSYQDPDSETSDPNDRYALHGDLKYTVKYR